MADEKTLDNGTDKGKQQDLPMVPLGEFEKVKAGFEELAGKLKKYEEAEMKAEAEKRAKREQKLQKDMLSGDNAKLTEAYEAKLTDFESRFSAMEKALAESQVKAMRAEKLEKIMSSAFGSLSEGLTEEDMKTIKGLPTWKDDDVESQIVSVDIYKKANKGRQNQQVAYKPPTVQTPVGGGQFGAQFNNANGLNQRQLAMAQALMSRN